MVRREGKVIYVYKYTHTYIHTYVNAHTHRQPLTKMLGTGFLSPFIANTTSNLKDVRSLP